MTARVRKKAFDQRYFDKWYRDSAHQVRTRSGVRRHAALAIAVAEYALERPVQRVLDVGCGEGLWELALRALRPRALYVGIEPSEYAVKRFGMRRNIRYGTFGALDELDDLERFDLIVCVDVLHYITRSEIVEGARTLGKRLNGVALLHAYAQGDDIEGDLRGLRRRTPQWYGETFRGAGLTSLGLGFWGGKALRDAASRLERL